MKFSKYTLSEWEEISPTTWRTTSATFDYPMANAWVLLYKIYARHSQGFAWYPEFGGELSFLQKYYDDITSFKEFKYNELEPATKYVDEFLIRMNNLKAFA